MVQALLNDLKVFLTLLFISLLLIFIDQAGILNLPKAGVQFITSPIQLGLYKTSLGVSKQFEFITLSRKASQENIALKEQLAQILSENASLRRKLTETEGFLTQQNSLDPQTFNLVAARPIGLNRFLLIDKGSDDGIKLNQTVLYKDNYLGKVKNLSPKKAQVLLLSDPDSKVAAYAANEAGKAKGVLAGQFGEEALLDKVLHQEPLKKGDLIYTDGTEENVPKGLVLGLVDEVFERDNEVFKQAKIKFVFDPADLDLVFVVTN